MEAAWLIACDGARSDVRSMLGLDFAGQLFEERFLIADVEMEGDFPSERRFWFEPGFHPGQSALFHKQPDNIYRIDLQLGWDADPEVEKQPERVIPRIRAMVGDRPFRLDWVSVYSFQCRRLERFVHDRVIFCGDSAHVVSPFGARGGNGGIQDADNLAWKLAAILKGEAPESLIESYNDERTFAADENIDHSTRATNFMTPKSAVETMFRDEVLRLAHKHAFARRLVNSGRLSLPCSLAGFPLQTPDDAAPLSPGSPAPDAPIGEGGGQAWLLSHLGGSFRLLSTGDVPDLSETGLEHIVVGRDILDTQGYVERRYGNGWTYLIRPDQHVAAAFRHPDKDAVMAAHKRARGMI